jgi:GntR family transcriptional regulator, transcriptional repressor for pyruvate dehydrogenase complex
MTSRAAPPSAPRRSRNLALEVVDAIGDRIRDGRLAAGDKLPTEAEIMAALGVSRTVVREALSKLQAAGQVRTRHGIGTFVVGAGDATPFRISPDQLATLQDVIAMLELRIGLETEAAALAAQRRSAQNTHFAELMAALGAGMIPRARLDVATAPLAMNAERRDYLRRVNAEHESIFDAIAAQDGEAARAAMRTHLANSRERRRRAQVQPARSPAKTRKVA